MGKKQKSDQVLLQSFYVQQKQRKTANIHNWNAATSKYLDFQTVDDLILRSQFSISSNIQTRCFGRDRLLSVEEGEYREGTFNGQKGSTVKAPWCCGNIWFCCLVHPAI